MKKIFTTFLALLFTANLFSQVNNIRFGELTTKDGLSKNQVNKIFQDSKGFMWFCTKDGLNRYDGSKVTVYRNDPSDPNSLISNTVKSMCEDSKGNLWILAAGGVTCFDRVKETFSVIKLPDTYKINIYIRNDVLYMSHYEGVITY